jgi:ABC-type taurine transport system substrate-binding protein
VRAGSLQAASWLYSYRNTEGRKEQMKMRQATGAKRYRSGAQMAFKRLSIGAVALGALAVGATAIGALAIGALAIRALVVKRGRIERLNIEELEVERLHVRELVVEQEQSPRQGASAQPS